MSESYDFGLGEGEQVPVNEDRGQLDYESIFNRMQHSEPSHKLTPERIALLLKGLQSGDDMDAMQSCYELNDFLSLNTEESLGSFQSKEFVAALTTLLQIAPHNIDLVLLAQRAMGNLLEALPHASREFAKSGAITTLCECLMNCCENIDPAEGAMKILSKLSTTEGPTILKEGGLVAAFTFFDFFSIDVQRKGCYLATNLLMSLPATYSLDSISTVIERLSSLVVYYDSKIQDEALACFWRLTGQFQKDEKKLQELCNYGVLSNLLSILSSYGQEANKDEAISETAFILALAILTAFCRHSGDLLRQLLGEGLSHTLAGLIQKISAADGKTKVKAATQLLEIVHLVHEMLPALPQEFAQLINTQPLPQPARNTVKKPAQRKGLASPVPVPVPVLSTGPNEKEGEKDHRLALYEEDPKRMAYMAEHFLHPLIVLHNDLASTLKPRITHTVIKLVYFTQTEVLEKTWKDSSFLTRLLVDKSAYNIASGVYLCEILMSKLPQHFKDYLVREGVLYQIQSLIDDPPTQTLPSPLSSPYPNTPPSYGGLGAYSQYTPSKYNSYSSAPLYTTPPSSYSNPAPYPGSYSMPPSMGMGLQPLSSPQYALMTVPVNPVNPVNPLSQPPQGLFSSGSFGQSPQHSPSLGSPLNAPTYQPSAFSLGTSATDLPLMGSTGLPKETLDNPPLIEKKIEKKKPAKGLFGDEDSCTASSEEDDSEEAVKEEESAKESKEPLEPLEPVAPVKPHHQVLAEWIVLHATNFRDKYFGGLDSVTNDFVLFKELITKLSECSQWPAMGATELASVTECVTTLAEKLRARKVSPFQFEKSQCVKHFLRYLTEPGPDREKRLRIFLVAFLESNNTGSTNDARSGLEVLVELLHLATANADEHFPCMLTPAQGPSSIKNLLQPFHMRVHRMPDETRLYAYDRDHVLVEPLALMQDVTAFLLQRVLGGEKEPKPEPLVEPTDVDLSNSLSQPTSPSEPVKSNLQKKQEKLDAFLQRKGKTPTPKSPNNNTNANPTTTQTTTPLTTQSASPPRRTSPNRISPRQDSNSNTASPTAKGKKTSPKKETEANATTTVSNTTTTTTTTDSAVTTEQPITSPTTSNPTTPTTKATPKSGKQARNSNANTNANTSANTNANSATTPSPTTTPNANANAKKPREKVPTKSPRSKAPLASFSAPSQPAVVLAPNECIALYDSNYTKLDMSISALQYAQREGFKRMARERGQSAGQEGHDGIRIWDYDYDVYYRIETLPEEKVEAKAEGSENLLDVALARMPSLTCLDGNANGKDVFGQKEKERGDVRAVFQLLWVLHTLNGSLGHFNKKENLTLRPVDSDCFINKNVITKLTRQLREAYTLTAEALPLWCCELTQHCKFLFPFDVRAAFFRSSALGVARALRELEQRVSLDGKATHSRITKQRVRLPRAKPLESAMKAMDLCVSTGSTKCMFGVEFFGEKGVGLGPTKEFFTLVSHDIQKVSLGWWICPEDQLKNNAVHIHAAGGLFPLPLFYADRTKDQSARKRGFLFLGQFVAKALMDGRLLDVPFSLPFCRLLLGENLTWHDLQAVWPEVGKSLAELADAHNRYQAALVDTKLSDSKRSQALSRIYTSADSTVPLAQLEVLDLAFEIGGHELRAGGSDEVVSLANVAEYLALAKDTLLGEGIKLQMDAFREGFNQFFSIQKLKIFHASELSSLIGGTCSPSAWEQNEILGGLLFGLGYSEKSKVIRYLLDILMSFSEEQRRFFLIWLTATPRLPVGGWAALSPKITVMAKAVTSDCAVGEENPDVPTANACFHQLKLPAYTSMEVMRERLVWAMGKGTGTFDLT